MLGSNLEPPLPSTDLSKLSSITSSVYALLLAYLNATGGVYRHHSHLPHPPRSYALPSKGWYRVSVRIQGRTYSVAASHPGNASIVYCTPSGDQAFGDIFQIWDIECQGLIRTFLMVAPHSLLSRVDEARNPFSSRPGFLCRLVYDDPTRSQLAVVESDRIVAHASFWRRPPGTFQITRPTRVLHNLDRAQRSSNALY